MKKHFCLFALFVASLCASLTAQTNSTTRDFTRVNGTPQGGNKVGKLAHSLPSALCSTNNFSGFRSRSPIASSSTGVQENIAQIPTAAVPESASLLLLGSGLAGLASLLKKRNRDKDSTDE